jgi:SSS family solute:Na+ symporter
MGFYGLGSYGVMAGISLVLAMVMSVLGCPGNRTRIYTARDGKVARKAFLAQGGMMFGWSIVTAIIGMSCFAIATHNGHTLATPNHAFPYMATQVMAPSIGLMFLICGLSAAVSSGGSSSISGVTILLTDVYPMLTGKSIPKEKYAFVSRIALLAALAIAFSITIFVTDMIDYIQKAVGAFLPGAAVAMIAGRFWKRATWQGALASVGCGTTLGLAIVLIPCVSAWVKSVFGGPAIPAVAVSALGVIAGSLLSPKDETPDEVRVASVMASRAGRVL